MVDVGRVRKKLCSLLCDGPTTEKNEWARRHRLENAIRQMRIHRPEKYATLETRLINVLEDFEKAIGK